MRRPRRLLLLRWVPARRRRPHRPPRRLHRRHPRRAPGRLPRHGHGPRLAWVLWRPGLLLLRGIARVATPWRARRARLLRVRVGHGVLAAVSNAPRSHRRDGSLLSRSKAGPTACVRVVGGVWMGWIGVSRQECDGQLARSKRQGHGVRRSIPQGSECSDTPRVNAPRAGTIREGSKGPPLDPQGPIRACCDSGWLRRSACALGVWGTHG